jgi:hypothetical protein
MPDALDKLIETAKLSGVVFLVFCAMMVAISIGGPEDYRVAQASLIVAMLVGHGVPGVVFLALAAWMSRGGMKPGGPWAFVVMTAFSVLCLIKTFLGMAMLCAGAQTMTAFAFALPLCAPLQVLFLAYVGGRCLIAWPEVTHLWKAAARERAYAQNYVTQPGQAVSPGADGAPPTPVSAAPVSPVIPPPPPRARSVRARSRPLENDEA